MFMYTQPTGQKLTCLDIYFSQQTNKPKSSRAHSHVLTKAAEHAEKTFLSVSNLTSSLG
jgi:hypothetical protein